MKKPADLDTPVHELISQRWSPRAFSGRGVSKENLHALLEAARWASSCFNEQPWIFLLAHTEKRESFELMLSCLTEGNRLWAKNAGVLMLTFAQRSFAHNGKANAHAWHDVGLAIANLTIEATSRGLFLHQMAGIDRDRIADVYDVPENVDVVTGIAIGHLGDAKQLPQRLQELEFKARARKPTSEFCFFNSFDGFKS